jgi:hypothetical protein
MDFQWIETPEKMIENIEKYGARAYSALDALAAEIAVRLQNYSRANASWQDRTGNARSGLFAVSEKAAGDLVTIYLSHGHSIDYGKWLELANAGKYAIIMPAIETIIPEAKRMLDEIFRD